ncbi:MAG: rhomboid family intramembrane serine protease, partial [Candidatus Azotimanducaceae bacterium]
LVFNLLWVWEVGRRIEIVSGTSVLLLIIIVSSLAANLFQYTISGSSFFGGMSGVVFGLFGYGAVWSWLVPGKTIGLAPVIYKVMLGYLLIGFTGIFSFLGLGDLANGAHLGGLIAGLFVGSVAGLLFRQNEEIL